jgi:YceI-like domain
MRPRKTRAIAPAIAFAVGGLLGGCTSPPATPTAVAALPSPSQTTGANAQAEDTNSLHARYLNLAHTGGQLFTLDPKTSSVHVYVFRGGAAAKLGHSHVLSAAEFDGYFYVPPTGGRAAQFDLEFQFNQLEIDNPRERAGLGDAFAGERTADDIAGTRAHMLGENSLQADRYPAVHVRSLRITGDAPKFAAEVAITMHGRTRNYWLALNVEGLPAHLAAAGALVLRQSDFDIKPYSVLGGLLAVEDELVIEFKLRGT